ncbi:hypothetical protein PM082_018186 [Marasmius tenuissimus]|nr:hypothetical protein PM082_018186 [Marasmius tenuissimus]
METEAALLMDAPGYNSTLPYRLALYHALKQWGERRRYFHTRQELAGDKKELWSARIRQTLGDSYSRSEVKEKKKEGKSRDGEGSSGQDGKKGKGSQGESGYDYDSKVHEQGITKMNTALSKYILSKHLIRENQASKKNADKLKETVDEKGKGKVPRTRLIERPIEGADCREGAGEKGKTSGLAPPEPPIQLSGPSASTFQEYENPSFPYSMKDDADDASFPIQLVRGGREIQSLLIIAG